MPTATAKRKQPRAHKPKLAQVLMEFRDIERRGEYQVGGEVRRIRVLRPDGSTKTMDLGRNTLWIGWSNVDGYPVVVNEWKGLPAHGPSGEFCKACLAPCLACANGLNGLKQCEICGGDGTIATAGVLCPADGCLEETGNPRNDCSQCKGRGEIYPRQTCPTCEGKGLAKCATCKGWGQSPTGLKGGSRDWMKRDNECENCRGTMREPMPIPHDLTPYLNVTAKAGKFSVIGPIECFSLDPPAGSAAGQKVIAVERIGEEHMVLLVSDETGEAFFVGGRIGAPKL